MSAPRQQDVRRLSAQFEHDGARTGRCLFDDLLADSKRTGEADLVDQSVPGQGLTDDGAAEDAFSTPAGNTCWASAPNISVDSGVWGEGASTTVHPAASAATTPT